MRTYGWDTVSQISIDKVNTALASSQGNLPMHFKGDPGTDPPVVAEGELARWSIVPGGAVRYLYLELEIKTGTLNIGTGTVDPRVEEYRPAWRNFDVLAYDLAGVRVISSVDLRMFRQSETQADDLRFNMTQIGSSLPPTHEGDVVPVKVIDPSGKLTTVAKTLLGVAMADFLVKNAGSIQFVFAHVSPIPPGVDSWLAPKRSDFAYIPRESDGGGILGVLSVTTDRDISHLERQIDPSTFRSGMSGSYVISRELVLRNVIKPSLATAYSTAPDVFMYLPEKEVIRNTRSFGTESVRSGAITYYPQIHEFELLIAGDLVQTTIRGNCDLKAGISMSFYMLVRNATTFDAGSKTLIIHSDPNPISSHSADIPWWFWFLGPLVPLITEIVVKFIASDIAGKLNGLVQSALSITKSPPKLVEWAGNPAFKIATAGLNDALFMMGQWE